MRFKSIVIIIITLLYGTSVSAECAWVLWVKADAKILTVNKLSLPSMSVIRKTANLLKWQPYSAHETKAVCERAAGDDKPIKEALLAEHGLNSTTTAVRHVVRRCLPDTVDPR